jgi:NAD dependent epimerase/dehydratase
MNLAGAHALVTGADGFIGSHLTEALVHCGAAVRALAFYNSFNSRGWLEALPPDVSARIDVVVGDVRDAQLMTQLMRGSQVVFHLAALVSIPYSYEAPESFVETNVRGTLNVLQAARRAPAERVLIVSSSEVYGSAREIPMCEDHPLQAQSPYSASKIGAESLAAAFQRSFGLPVVIARPFNTYGPRQSARAVIPAIAIQLLAGHREVRVGNIAPTRDFVFVDDTVRALIALAQCDAAVGHVVNIATGVDTSIADVADELVRQINPRAILLEDAQRLRPRDSEIERLLGCNHKLREFTGWSPRYTLAEGLALTTGWLREPANLAHYKADAYSL